MLELDRLSICPAISAPNLGEEGTIEPICNGLESQRRKNRPTSRATGRLSDDERLAVCMASSEVDDFTPRERSFPGEGVKGQ
jgi:hypothetical protein